MAGFSFFIAAHLQLDAAVIQGSFLCCLKQLTANAGSPSVPVHHQFLYLSHIGGVMKQSLHVQAGKSGNPALLLIDKIMYGRICPVCLKDFKKS